LRPKALVKHMLEMPPAPIWKWLRWLVYIVGLCEFAVLCGGFVFMVVAFLTILTMGAHG